MNITIITGQTATGKTALALSVARRENADIINFDARQIYKKLDIVTGKDFDKPDFHKEYSHNGFDIGYYRIGGIKVWLYDVVSPKVYFSSYDYAVCAKSVLKYLKRLGKNAVLVGGTYLYLYHLLYSVDTENIPPDTALRGCLKSRTVKELQAMLEETDPQLFAGLNQSERNNPQRLIRKIELARQYAKRGKKVPLTMKYDQNTRLPGKITAFTGLSFARREDAQKTIGQRVAKRLEQGALQEVRDLLSQGYKLDDPGMRTIGYQELGKYLNGGCSLSEAVSLWTTHELQYTKRQLTFMKKDPHIKWELI